MQKYQIQKLREIYKMVNDQIYLLKVPQTSQQIFLHLLGHRILVGMNILHKNIDFFFDKLQGTIANSYLNICYVSKCIENDVDLDDVKFKLNVLVKRWINFYPSFRNLTKQKCYIQRIIADNAENLQKNNGFYNYLAYVNMISIDLWKIIKNKNHQEEFHTIKHIKEDLKECLQMPSGKFDAQDLLDFVQSCLPKTIFNIILDQKKLPPQLRLQSQKTECLYSNKAVQFYLRTFLDIPILVKHIFLILLTISLNNPQQKLLIDLAMRYFLLYHFDRKYCASEIIIYSFNTISKQIKQSLKGEFVHFFKVMFKLGKNRFINFVSNNSKFIQNIVVNANLGLVGYKQQSINPYNSAKISQTFTIEKGCKVAKYFQILQDCSIICFRIEVINLDINFNLYFLGSFAAQQQQKNLLVKYQRISGELKHSINLNKKGLYMFEFDNSLSWINKKTILYQNQILTPLQIREIDRQPWIPNFYNFIQMNQMANVKDIKYFKANQQRSQNVLKFNVIQKKDGFMVMKINKDNEEYVYQTDNLQLMRAKVKQFYYSQSKYKWRIHSNTVQDFSQILLFLQTQISQINKNSPNKLASLQSKKPQISNLPQFESQSEQSQDS